jgi:predicted nucleic acid-binding Zn ribbon protein
MVILAACYNFSVMERAGTFLGRAVRKMARPEATLAWLQGAWPEIVGAALAAHAKPLRCAGKCLEIVADGKRWERQLETMTREFCERINRAWGSELVDKIRFVEAPGVQKAPHEADIRHTPFIRRGKKS